MKDELRDYIGKHKLAVPPAPVGEWERIQLRLRWERGRRVWVYGAAATLSAAAVLLAVNLSVPRLDERLEAEDIIYHEDVLDRGAYNDWLWLTDSVDVDE